MSGFDGRISFEGNTEQAKRLLGLASKLAARQHESKGLLGLASSVRTYDLGGGAFCTISDQSNMRAMHIVAPVFPAAAYVIPEEVPQAGVTGVGVYDVLSGVTHDPTIVIENIVDKAGKKKQVTVLKQFKSTKRTSARHKDLLIRQRLAVDENPIFAPLGNPNNIRFSEHAHVKPSNYTGIMAEVVQVLLGIGKVVRPTLEEMKKLKPLQLIGTDLHTNLPRTLVSGFGLYGKETAFTPRVDFDYRAAKTHGVTLDGDSVAWVIEIGFRGVHAMRLYMDPVSTTKEGIKRWAEVNPELIDFLALVSGMPLGLTLPTFDLFDKFKRAGEVVELISQENMRVFYDKVPMSSDTGWAFDDWGFEAHNTCWKWGDDFVKEGFHYGISIKLQNERFLDWTTKRSELARKFKTVYEVNKCRRMTEGDADLILREYATKGDAAGYKKFDAYVVKPTLVGMAQISLQKSGKLYHPAPFKYQPQIKIPETLMGGCISFDFSDAGDSPDAVTRTRHYVRCDTPMYVCYIDGKLEVINYSFDNTKPDEIVKANSESTRGECQYEGKWTITDYEDSVIVMMGHFYTNRWDFRREQRLGATRITEYTGTKIGAWPIFAWAGVFSTIYYTWTEVYFFVEGVQRMLAIPPSLDISIAIPWHDRGAYYLAKVETVPDSLVSYFGNVEGVAADEMLEWQIYDRIIHRFDEPSCSDWIDPAPKDCIARKRCRYPVESCRSENVHQDFLFIQCPNMSEGPGWPGPDLPSAYDYSAPDDPGAADSVVFFVNDTAYGATITKELYETYIHGSSLDPFWWIASPTDDGAIAVIEAVRSCSGESTTNMMDEFSGKLLHLGTPEYMFDIWNACYTGVIEND